MKNGSMQNCNYRDKSASSEAAARAHSSINKEVK